MIRNGQWNTPRQQCNTIPDEILEVEGPTKSFMSDNYTKAEFRESLNDKMCNFKKLDQPLPPISPHPLR